MRSSTSLRELAGVAVGATFLSIWWLWPLPRHMATRFAYFFGNVATSRADVDLTLWILSWSAHALVTDPVHLFHANAFHPSPLSLAFSEHLLGLQPLFAPVYWTTGNAVLAANLLVLATYPLCATAMYAFARRFVGIAAAAIAGFFYAFCLSRYFSLASFHMLAAYGLPLALLFTERWLAEARRRDAWLLSASIVVQALSAYYLAVALALLYGTYLPLALWRWRRLIDRRRLVGLFLALAGAASVILLVSLPHWTLHRLGVIPSYGGGDEALPMGLWPWVGENMALRYLRAHGVGPVGYALALLALLPAWRSGRWPRVIGLVVAVVGTTAAFGLELPIGGRHIWSPYRLLFDWVPGFASVRLPSRFVVVAQLGFALLAALGFERLCDRWSARPRSVAALAVVALALWSFAPFAPMELYDFPSAKAVSPAYRWLAGHGEGRPLLELPEPDPIRAARRMYLSTTHWLPIVDGYAGYPLGTASYIHTIARPLPATAALQSLVDTVDIGWILVHADELRATRAERWRRTLPPGLERVGSWNGDVLFRVTRPVEVDQRARFLSVRETLAGTPRAPLGPDCRGELRPISAPPAAVAPLGRIELAVRAVNQGPTPWPALGIVPYRLVRLRSCVRASAAEQCVRTSLPLPADVAPGTSVVVPVPLAAPLAPGEYVIEVDLVQVREGPLSACGVAPLRIPLRVADRRR